jgi:hypothetical protein
VRDLLALGAALNATLVLPQLICSCDKYWGLLQRCRHPHSPPTEMRFPMACPQDALFDPARWEGAGWVRFRESSFLESPRVPERVRRNAVRVFARQGFGGARAGSAISTATATVPAGTPMARVLPHVTAVRPSVRIVEISLADLQSLCPSLGDSEAMAIFNRRARDLLSDRAAFCAEESNPNFPGWSGWDTRHPPLNCTHGFRLPPDLPEAPNVCASWSRPAANVQYN